VSSGPAGRLLADKVIVAAGALADAAKQIADTTSRRSCAIISDSNVFPIFGRRLESDLVEEGVKPISIVLPPGENSKTLENVARVADDMIAAGLDRHSFVIGLGGGVIGDLSGFVAAIFHRGIPHIQIPTTLLAMVDSSIGGKTGVNTAAGKNLLGAIHQPSLVIDDLDVLKTLPPRELSQGFAEIIKHAIIADPKMFAQLQRRQLTEDLEELIRRNIEIKARFVADDEQDLNGQRAVLNFGHTIGHAIERAGDFRQFLHGEAVSLGLVAAARISVKRAGLPGSDASEIEKLLGRSSLPTSLPNDFDRDKIMRAVTADKKFKKGQVRFVVSPSLGSAYLSSEVTLRDIEEAVDQL
jgi:3-dehydroquinate synthase